jgi:hypothetical protein
MPNELPVADPSDLLPVASATDLAPITTSQKASSNLASMKGGESLARYTQAMADAQQDINSRTQKAGEAIALVPFILATPFTAGASVAAGLGIMGTMGAVGGLAREGTKKAFGSTEVKGGKDLALALGVDFATGAAAEGLGLVGKWGLGKFVTKSAMGAAKGEEVVTTAYAGLRDVLDTAVKKVGDPAVKVGPLLYDVALGLKGAPRGVTAIGKEFTAKSPLAQKLVDLIDRNIGTSAREPLTAAIEMYGQLQQAAWTKGALNPREWKIVTNGVKELGNVINKELANVPDGVMLFDKARDIGRTIFRRNVVLDLAKAAVGKFAGNAIFGAGGAYAGYKHGGVPGAIKGAVVGAAIPETSAAVVKASTAALHWAMAHPQAAKQIGLAVEAASNGLKGEAAQLMSRALSVSGADQIAKETFRLEAEEPEQPPQ